MLVPRRGFGRRYTLHLLFKAIEEVFHSSDGTHLEKCAFDAKVIDIPPMNKSRSAKFVNRFGGGAVVVKMFDMAFLLKCR